MQRCQHLQALGCFVRQNRLGFVGWLGFVGLLVGWLGFVGLLVGWLGFVGLLVGLPVGCLDGLGLGLHLGCLRLGFLGRLGLLWRLEHPHCHH